MSEHKILVIDDEPMVIEAVRKALKREGYEILSACNGEEGLRLYFEHQPVLVILDLRMPVMDGLQFLDYIKLKPLDRSSVIVLTGHGSDYEIEQCFRKGVSAFIRKPFNIYELIGQVRSCIALKDMKEIIFDLIRASFAEAEK
ncbi:response regulator [Desulfonema magnum]|uniref:Two component system response regulator n=1 Tax=Desulfonema magnum TaxID=45655 RepID=A0A975BL02_9BACT|nr:response regulator [Desulfonema magnum]QTA87353.1 Two component system response regulator [Desulfonema magnum]